jgi:phage I-like protein/cation transport regulator ChaB
MPYDIKNPPDVIRMLPPHAQEMWISAFNEASKDTPGDEGKCAAIAWAAVEREYKKDERGNWEKMGEPTMNRSMFCLHDLAGVAPAEVQLAPYGTHRTPKYGILLVDDESLGSVMAHAAEQANDRVIDYEHQTFAEPPVIAPAAGWIKKLVNRGKDGVWGIVEWTEKARQMIANREYRYLSPVTLTRKSDGKVLAILGAGLTNMPNIDGMVPLVNKAGLPEGSGGRANKEEPMWKELLKLLGLPEDATEAAAMTAVNNLRGGLASAQRIVANKAVLAALGVAEAAGEAEVVVTINNLKAGNQIVANKNVLDALGVKPDAPESEVVGTIMAMRQAHANIGELTSQVNTLNSDITKRNADELVEMAMKQGKITPAQKDWALQSARKDPEGFKVFLNKAPVVVRFDRVAGEEEAADRLDETQVSVNRLLGVTDESWKKHHKVA